MLFNISWLEWVGYVSSVLVAVSLTMSSIKKLRWYNLVGAAIFSFYGFAIQAYPVGVLNLFIVLANVYYLRGMYSASESFKVLKVEANDPYLEYFVDFHKAQIQNFFPRFDKSLLQQNEVEHKAFTLFLLRNAVVAGVFFGIKNNHILYLHLDFVSAPYRDLKPGEFIYKQNKLLFKEAGIRQIVCNTENEEHRKYLLKMGFVEKAGGNNVFEMNLQK